MVSWFLNSLVGLSQTNSGPAQTNKTLRTFCTFADALGWDVPLWHKGSNLQSLNLVEFLSTRMIRGDLVDVMIESIVQRIRLNPDLHEQVSVEDHG